MKLVKHHGTEIFEKLILELLIQLCDVIWQLLFHLDLGGQLGELILEALWDLLLLLYGLVCVHEESRYGLHGL